MITIMKKTFAHLIHAVRHYYMLIIPLVILSACFYYYILRDLPSPIALGDGSPAQSTQIFDRNDTLLYTIYADKNSSFISLSHIPKTVQDATIAVEDKDFYHHGAIDMRGVLRAIVSNLMRKPLQGGSTLTQQLIKNSLLTQDRTIQRKAKEVVLSFATELIYPKKTILEMYLNQVPYGGTAYGIQAAAQTYFGKDVQNLDLAESAYLAGLPEAPSTFSPFGERPDLGKKRQEDVLSKMAEQGLITATQETAAKNEKLQFNNFGNTIKAPHFVFYIKDLLIKKYGAKIVGTGGLKVKTSLDLTLQDYAQATVEAEINKLRYNNVGNGAALITNPTTGEILAMVGSKDYFGEPEPLGCTPGANCDFEPNVNLTTSQRQPGSSIKPINYAVGLIKGYTAATPFIDQAMCFGGTPNYCPKNYDSKYHGVVQMRYALANSLNIPAVEMLKLNTIDAMIATASAMGITTFTDKSRYGLSLTLGGGEVYMTDMATAFGVFANKGYRVNLHPILQITDKHGKTLEQYIPPSSPIFGKQVLPPGVSFIISNILMDNKARQMEFGPHSPLEIPNQPVSVKTGTTNDFRDNWTIGYSHGPSYLVAVWVGNNDHSQMQGIVSGITGAAPIWHDLMAHLLEGKQAELPTVPQDVIGKSVCATSGLLPTSANPCPTRFEYFIKGLEPKGYDNSTQNVFIDKTTNTLAKPGQTDNVEQKTETIVRDPLGNSYCVTCSQPTISPTP
jgi:penicillin-binding protein 1C